MSFIELPPLSPADYRLASETGTVRGDDTRGKGGTCLIEGTDEVGLNQRNNQQGTKTELAVARYYGLEWSLEHRCDINTKSDVGDSMLQVRSTRSRRPELAFYAGNNPGAYYLLVWVETDQGPHRHHYFLCGGAWGYDLCNLGQRRTLPRSGGRETIAYYLPPRQLEPPWTREARDQKHDRQGIRW